MLGLLLLSGLAGLVTGSATITATMFCGGFATWLFYTLPGYLRGRQAEQEQVGLVYGSRSKLNAVLRSIPRGAAAAANGCQALSNGFSHLMTAATIAEPQKEWLGTLLPLSWGTGSQMARAVAPDPNTVIDFSTPLRRCLGRLPKRRHQMPLPLLLRRGGAARTARRCRRQTLSWPSSGGGALCSPGTTTGSGCRGSRWRSS